MDFPSSPPSIYLLEILMIKYKRMINKCLVGAAQLYMNIWTMPGVLLHKFLILLVNSIFQGEKKSSRLLQKTRIIEQAFFPPFSKLEYPSIFVLHRVNALFIFRTCTCESLNWGLLSLGYLSKLLSHYLETVSFWGHL